MNWIKVAEKLPNPGDRVLFCSRYDPDSKPILTWGWYKPSKDGQFPWRDGYVSGDGPSVTHWAYVENPTEE